MTNRGRKSSSAKIKQSNVKVKKTSVNQIPDSSNVQNDTISSQKTVLNTYDEYILHRKEYNHYLSSDDEDTNFTEMDNDYHDQLSSSSLMYQNHTDNHLLSSKNILVKRTLSNSSPSSSSPSSKTSLNSQDLEKNKKSKSPATNQQAYQKKTTSFWKTYFVSSSRPSYLWAFSRYPLLLMIGAFLILDLFLYLLTWKAVSAYENMFVWRGKKKQLKRALDEAKDYQEWLEAAKQLDDLFENSSWKIEPSNSTLYDEKLILKITKKLKLLERSGARSRIDSIENDRVQRNKSNGHHQNKKKLKSSSESVELDTKSLESQRVRDMCDTLLHGGCKANIGGIENEYLYSHTFVGTKRIVEQYVDQIQKTLTCIEQVPFLSNQEKYQFFKKCSRVYGRTALCLSGGASFGYYHIGVVKALIDNGCMPQIISGTSAGSLMAATLSVRTDKELYKEIFTPEWSKNINACESSWKDRLINFYKTGAMFDSKDWFNKTCKLLKGSNITFLEAYERTGRILNISVVPDKNHAFSKQLNYITAPDVIIASAVIASSAVPGILNPVQLYMKRKSDGQLVPYRGSGKLWRDGSLNMDIPERELHILFDVNYTIVSQVNPHIVGFFYERQGSAGCPTPHRRGKGWRGGFLGSALIQHFKLDLQKWMLFIRDLQLLPRILDSDFSEIFLQTFEGSVTIVPAAVWEDYAHLVTDPDEKRFLRYMTKGQNHCWPKLGMIRNRLKIEQKLAEYLHRYQPSLE